MFGVIMITDPFGRSAAFEDNVLNNRAIDDHIDNDLISKLTGLAICLPSVLSLAGESKSSLYFTSPVMRSKELTRSDGHALHQGSSINLSDYGHHLVLPCNSQRHVRILLCGHELV
jgi:hypothetical protein